MASASKLAITAVIVTCNEKDRLRKCLESLDFCDEVIVCDLFSEDGSDEIGRKFADKFLQRPRVDFADLLWAELFSLAGNDWVLRFDPDQVIPEELVSGIRKVFPGAGDASCIYLPMLYYFLERPLYYSIWGKVRYFPLLINRKYAQCSGVVHGGVFFSPDRRQIKVEGYEDNPIEHYWVDSIGKMITKHLRYLKHEGTSRKSRGEIFSFRKMAAECQESFFGNFIQGGCLQMGWRGVFLGSFHVTYVLGANISLALEKLKSRS